MLHFSESPRLSHMFSSRERLADQVRDIVSGGKLRGVEPGSPLHKELISYVEPKRRRSALEGGSGARSIETIRRASALEAIVLLVGRPPLLVRNGTYVAPTATSSSVPRDTIDYIAALQRAPIDNVIARTGRVDIVDVPGMPFLGTGWIIEKRKDDVAIMVTNRHVAFEFARADGHGGFRFMTAPNFRPYQAEIGFVREHLNDIENQKQARVERVLYIAANHDPDIALLEVTGEHVKGLDALEPWTGTLKRGLEIGVVGYPAYDSRNDAAAIARYFDGIFNVKRFAFGEVSGIAERHPEFTHDATTLGGNSGSCVFELDSGAVVGLHFAGDYRSANYAVPIEQVKMALAGLKTSAVVRRDTTEAISDGVKPVAFYKGRDGYDPEFLGKAGKRVDLPGLAKKWKNDAASVKDADTGKKVKELKYRHFSVVMSESRKLPLITAVNINGNKSKRIGRIDKWYVDGRLPEKFQVGNEAYARNPLDRGHMVRREDPVWGTMKEAEQANIDTFHYTNCAPQHSGLNQREWLRLEDYVLGNARTHKLMVSVFTGPILRDDDPVYERDDPEPIEVQLPRDFWKVAVIVDAETKKPSATGYVLTQGGLIRRLTEAFVYGAFRTYQVPISLIETESGLDFSDLTPHDPFARQRREEGVEGTTRHLFNPIASAADVVMA